jgi:hypothetical protein
MSAAGAVAVPTATDAVVLRVGVQEEVVGHVPFEGKLRAGRVINSRAVLVNESGRVFKSDF